MRAMALAIVAIGIAVVVSQTADAAEKQGQTCRTLASRGKAWADCCAQSYARRPSDTVSRKERLSEIERCVRSGS